MMWEVNATPRPLYTWKDHVPTVQEAGWAPEPVWTGVENLILTGIRSPDRPSHSQSLYRPSCPAHYVLYTYNNSFFFLVAATTIISLVNMKVFMNSYIVTCYEALCCVTFLSIIHGAPSSFIKTVQKKTLLVSI